jgi:hypothetical protein
VTTVKKIKTQMKLLIQNQLRADGEEWQINASRSGKDFEGEVDDPGWG